MSAALAVMPQPTPILTGELRETSDAAVWRSYLTWCIPADVLALGGVAQVLREHGRLVIIRVAVASRNSPQLISFALFRLRMVNDYAF
jgi:hypothetical protein